MQLPEIFTRYTREMLGDERFERLSAALDEEPPISIRLNPAKCADMTLACSSSQGDWEMAMVPWCPEGYYLSGRPPFTFDPLLHAGCYYVQEASSMFVAYMLRQLVHLPVAMLDLCAAPGGKTTAALTALPAGSRLWANEPVRQRAQVLEENLQKWGAPACTVTTQQAQDFCRQDMTFDAVLCDVPCSGEGMFRKDPSAVREWTPQNVEKCWRLQRKIVTDIWPCLKPGGLMIYSTCTLNTKENEENVRWICNELGAEPLPVATKSEWGIMGSLLEGFDAPVYRFLPGFTRGEGLFMAAMRKTPPPTVELTYAQAVAYLQRQALQLPPDTPLGLVEVTFMGKRLGMVKNVGNRANNLYPQEWRIKSTHTPNDYEAILRHP